jgi:hypothetical protein
MVCAFACVASAFAQPGPIPGVPASGGAFTGPVTLATPNGTITPSPAVLRSAFNPSVHLAKFLATTTPTFCIVGDSSYSQGDYNSPIDSFSAKFQAALTAAYPTKTITFKDFTIGGTGLDQYPSGTSFGMYPAWYTNHALTWGSDVAAAGCTSIMFNFGMNDAGSETTALWNTALTAVVGYTPLPDVIFATPIVANAAAGTPYNTDAYVYGNNANAALQRSIALSNDKVGVPTLPQIGLIDINRWFNMAVYGRDPVEQIMTNIIPSTAPVVAGTTTTSQFTYDLPATDGDFDVIVQLTGGSALTAAGSTIVVGLYDSENTDGTSPANGYTAYSPNSGTNCFQNTYYVNNTNKNTLVNTWAAGTNTIEVSVQDSHVQLYCSGALAADFLMPRASGPFIPYVSILTPPAGVVVTINQYSAGKMRKYSPLVSQAACYGSLGGSDSGNGIDHVASDCLNAVYGTVIETVLGGSSAATQGGYYVDANGNVFAVTLNASANGIGSLTGAALTLGVTTLSRNGVTGALTISTNASDLLLAPAGNVVAQSPSIVKNYTVAGLPTCNTALRYAVAAVSDATAPTYNAALTGGGAVFVPVFCNGTAWVSH